MNYFDKRVAVLKDEAALLEVYSPERIEHRDGQKQQLASCLRPVTLNRRPRNAFLYGPCGTGKTLVAQYLLKELEQHTSKARGAYVNCWKRNTTHAALVEILNQLDIYTNYRQAVTDLLKYLEKESERKQVIVCLDEVDALDSMELLYDLSRSGIGVVAVSNDPYVLVDLDTRIKSSLSVESIEFPAYDVDAVYEILQQRKPYAFLPGAAPERALKLAARLSAGDARIALETVRRAALMAEDDEREALNIDDVKKAFTGGTKNLRKTEALKRLNEHEKTIYLLLEEKKELSTKDLWDEYNKRVKDPASQRSYRNYCNHLVRLGLVEASGKLTGRKYRFMV